MIDILDRLTTMANLQPGSPFPPEIGENIGWALAISGLCREAAAEIERLRKPPTAPKLEDMHWGSVYAMKMGDCK